MKRREFFVVAAAFVSSLRAVPKSASIDRVVFKAATQIPKSETILNVPLYPVNRRCGWRFPAHSEALDVSFYARAAASGVNLPVAEVVRDWRSVDYTRRNARIAA